MRLIRMAVVAAAAFLPTANSTHAAVAISTNPTTNMNCSGGTCTPTAAKAVLNVSQLTGMLANGDVTVSTTAEAPDIVVDAPFSWASAHGLTLEAVRSAIVNRSVVDAGPGALTLTTNATGGGGMLSFGKKGSIAFIGLSNALTIDGRAYVLVNSVKSLAREIAGNPKGNFALAADYDAGNDGIYTQSPIVTRFEGNFLGLGNSISNLKVESAHGNILVGLFRLTAPNAVIAYLQIKSGDFYGWLELTGGIVADNSGTLIQDSFNGTIDVNINTTQQCAAGGIAGINEGKISYSRSSGKITSTGGQCSRSIFGGLVGHNNVNGSIDESSSTANVSKADWIGGLAGENAGPITSSVANGAVSTGKPNALAGGLVGANIDAGIADGFCSGAVTASGSGSFAGGLVGEQYGGLIDSSVSNSAVSGGPSSATGGFVGAVDLTYYTGTISKSVAYGAVSAGTGSLIGGFVGDDKSPGNMSSDAWDMTTTGITNPKQGAGNLKNDPGITGFK